MEIELENLACAACGSTEHRLRYEARMPPNGRLDFSARRDSRGYHPRIVECTSCGQIYSNPYFTDAVLARLYSDAQYIEEPQLRNMAADYFREFRRAVGEKFGSSMRVLEIGCGNGFFLERLAAAGLTQIQGVEPSREALKTSPRSVRNKIHCGIFNPAMFPAASFDAVCCFQIFDHIRDPIKFVGGIRQILKTGGVLLAINHNIRAPITRLLGEHSPMYDVEHIYLFDRTTIRLLLEKNGFVVPQTSALWNSYTMEYVLKMLPLPRPIKTLSVALASTLKLGETTVRLPGGNMVTVGIGTG